MVDKNVIISRVEQIDKHLDKLNPYISLTYEQFLKDSITQDVVEYNLFQIVNHIVDVVEHIVVDEDYGLPSTSYEAIQIFLDKEVIDKTDLKLLKEMIGFRNVVGHEYININKEIVYNILKSNLPDIKRIVSKIVQKFI
ncbi:MAG: DUF86 domain-containing protein [Candidatus Omnitrophota bacterium]